MEEPCVPKCVPNSQRAKRGPAGPAHAVGRVFRQLRLDVGVRPKCEGDLGVTERLAKDGYGLPPVGSPAGQRDSAWYSSFGIMSVAIAIRFVKLYIAAISATSHASSRVRPTASNDAMSSLVISRGVRVSFSA